MNVINSIIKGKINNTFGILVIPPTSNTSLMSLVLTSASLNACLQGAIVRSINDDTSDSNFDLVIVTFKCFGTPASTVMNGRLMSVCKGGKGKV